MRLIELLVVVLLFFGNLADIFRIKMKLTENEKKVIRLMEKNECKVFISESFRQSCKGSGFGSLDEWKENCRLLYNLDYIEWEVSADGKLFAAKWEWETNREEAYCFVPEKGETGDSKT